MLDLAAATPESFTPWRGTGFVLRLALTSPTSPTSSPAAATAAAAAAPSAPSPATPVTLELVEVNAAAGPRPGQLRRSFSLVFRGPRGLYLPQRVYRLEHEDLGALDLFLVPIQPDAQGSLFEAVFN